MDVRERGGGQEGNKKKKRSEGLLGLGMGYKKYVT